MPIIDVDFDVYKALVARRPSEEVTENDVLRQLLRLPRKAPSSADALAAADDWVIKGVRIPAGSELRAKYKGQIYSGVVAEGALVVNGQRFASPSAAAM